MIKLFLNTVTLLVTLAVNYYAASGILTGKTIGDISKKYETLFTPADYAFAIWGFIYLMLFLFVAYQWYAYFKEKDKHLLNLIGIWFIVANIANSAWVLLWIREYIGLSVVMMILLILSLIMLVRRLNLEKWDAPIKIIVFIWWPISFYLGWIIVAAVANVAAYFTSIGWEGAPLSEKVWTITMLIVATVIYLRLLRSRNMREASLVGIWAFIAIAVKQWEVNPSIAWTAIILSLILLARAVRHAYKNRHSSPFKKLMG